MGAMTYSPGISVLTITVYDVESGQEVATQVVQGFSTDELSNNLSQGISELVGKLY